jgi:polyisoprenoid-binding protein YceI
MRHRAKIAIIVSACVIVAGTGAAFAAPAIYRNFIAAPPEDVPSLTVDDSALDTGTGEALDPAALSGTWVPTDGSEAGYRVDEVLNGTDVTVTGRTKKVSGTVETDGLQLTAATLTVDVASIATDNGSRDAYFRDNALNVSDHPTATFELTGPVTAGDTPKSGTAVDQKLAGTLTIAGVTRDVTFSAQASTDGETARVVGRIPITFADFGVQAPDLGFVKVEPDGYVEFDLTLVRE